MGTASVLVWVVVFFKITPDLFLNYVSVGSTVINPMEEPKGKQPVGTRTCFTDFHFVGPWLTGDKSTFPPITGLPQLWGTRIPVLVLKVLKIFVSL